MSAYICSDKHIATIATWASSDVVTAQEIADALLRENIRSVNYRYKERTRFSTCRLEDAVTDVTPADVVALCDCLDYQSCEHPDYKRGMLAMIRKHAFCMSGGAKSDIWSI